MKTKVAAALIAGLLAFAPCTQAAKTATERLAAELVGLDELIREADIPSFTPALAPILKVEAAPLSKVLVEQKLKFSDVVMAQLVAEKTEKALVDVLQVNPTADWAKILEGSKVQLDDAIAYLEEVHTNVAFAMMDQPKKKAKKK